MKKNKNVVVLGASTKSERYSNQAVRQLSEDGYNVIPVHPSGVSVNGLKTLKSLRDVDVPIDTLSIYVNPAVSSGQKEDILNLSPRRIIFNPGTENRELEDLCRANGTDVVEACTLVLLRTGVF